MTNEYGLVGVVGLGNLSSVSPIEEINRLKEHVRIAASGKFIETAYYYDIINCILSYELIFFQSVQGLCKREEFKKWILKI